ncbi:MAG: transcriptional regulator, TetR family [Rhizobacter sp.]|nr:transcriptional regulator, TetR family [Rhizobacter sp.]
MAGATIALDPLTVGAKGVSSPSANLPIPDMPTPKTRKTAKTPPAEAQTAKTQTAKTQIAPTPSKDGESTKKEKATPTRLAKPPRDAAPTTARATTAAANASTTTTDKPRAPRSRNKDSKEILLGHAARLFREKGYTATSIRDIVKRARVEPSALYYHYASKEALLDAVLDRSILSVLGEVREAVDRLPEGTPPRERIKTAIATHIRSIIVHGDYALASRRVIGEIPPAIRRKHAAMRADYGAYWQSLFERVAEHDGFRDDVRPGLARMFLMGALNWSSEWFDPKRKSPEDMAQVFCDILFEGLGPSAALGKPRR